MDRWVLLKWVDFLKVLQGFQRIKGCKGKETWGKRKQQSSNRWLVLSSKKRA